MTSVLPSSRADRQHNSALLRPGTLIYLWPPGCDGGEPPVRVRVERANSHTIIGTDQSNGQRADYAVGRSPLDPPGMAWTWAIAELPNHLISNVTGIDVVERDTLTPMERARHLFGEPGTPLVFRLHGGDTVRGVVTRMSISQGEIVWIEVTGPADMRGPVRHRLKIDGIAGITEQGAA